MKIAIITDQFPPQFGGMASHAYYVSKYLAEKHEVKVFKARSPDSDYSKENFSVQSLLTLRFPTIDFIILWYALKRFCPDVLHVCTAGLNYSLLSRRYPTLTRVVGNDFLRPWCGFNLPLRFILYRIPNKSLLKRVQKFEFVIRKQIIINRLKTNSLILANSEWTLNQLQELNIPKDKIQVVSGGVDSKAFKPAIDKEKIRGELDLPREKVIILTIAALVKKKGIDSVIRAIEKIRNKQNLLYLIIGDGIEKQSLMSLVKQLKLLHCIQFFGKMNHQKIIKYYQASDIYVQPSRNSMLPNGSIDVETMGRTFCEAGACCLPVIATNVGGIPSVVKHMENGLLIDDPENLDDLNEKMQLLIDDQKLRERMGKQGYRLVQNTFSWHIVCSRIEQFINEIT